MRFSSSTLALGLVSLAQAALISAPIYLFNQQPDARRGEAVALSPKTARQLFARRLGISSFYRLDELDDAEVSRLNDYGGSQHLLSHAQDAPAKPAQLLLLVEGVEKPEDTFPKKVKAPSLSMLHPPAPPSNLMLAKDFSQQLGHWSSSPRNPLHIFEGVNDRLGPAWVAAEATKRACATLLFEFEQAGQDSEQRAGAKPSSIQAFSALLDGILQSKCGNGAKIVIHMSDIQKASSASYKESMKQLSSALGKLTKLSENGEMESMVVLFPPVKSDSNKHSGSYGKASMPPAPKHVKRQASEAPLEASRHDSRGSSATVQPAAGNATTLPRGVLPLCYTSFNSCVTATNNCSGHGSCYRKYGAPGGNDAAAKSCYSCRCRPTELRDSDTRVQTYYWGGAACEKQDVSVPFFLLAGFSVFIVAALAWGIGSLFSVGQEPLPSVIGAGVVAPRPK